MDEAIAACKHCGAPGMYYGDFFGLGHLIAVGCTKCSAACVEEEDCSRWYKSKQKAELIAAWNRTAGDSSVA